MAESWYSKALEHKRQPDIGTSLVPLVIGWDAAVLLLDEMAGMRIMISGYLKIVCWEEIKFCYHACFTHGKLQHAGVPIGMAISEIGRLLSPAGCRWLQMVGSL